MHEDIERYKKTYDEFYLLLNYGEELIEKVSLNPVSEHIFYGDRIFAKLLCHGKTLLKISPSLTETEPMLWDVSSSYAISRALIETYDALAYIALGNIDDEEREFRLIFWQFHSELRRSQMLEQIGSNNPSLKEIVLDVENLKNLLLAHPHLKKCKVELENKIKKGECEPYHLNQRERNELSEINNEYYKAIKMHLSQYVHTYPFSVFQISEFQAGSIESLGLMGVSIQYSLAFLVKSIADMCKIFEPNIPEQTKEIEDSIALWTTLIKHGIKQ